MNIMFLLIPALLLAMEVASMAAVAISPPKHTDAPTTEPKPPDDTKKLELKVFILSDGFRVSSAAQQQGADAGKALDSSAPTIPLAKPNAAADDYDRYDYAALGAIALDFKSAYPSETVVTISAENDVPAQVLIETMDALRGWDCKLGQVKADEEMPEACMFFRPVIEAGAG
ncbi:TolR-like protein [Enhygromyxa salina]|uniref:TolR-like protein n=2 Tax=Enhygromyxa salina TaxID=215803 RepID=A0A0C2CWD0_9BACT|nr:TolR-like protein [Enhygromyxa salina]